MNALPAGPCAKCGGAVTCRYNRFQKPGLLIDSWEHKCSDCGARETEAFRHEGDAIGSADERQPVCPYCGRPAG